MEPEIRQYCRINSDRVITEYLPNLFGPRKLRRSKQRHHPFFTKSRHKGREWAIRLANKDAT